MQRCETVMTGERYKLVRYDVGDNDELYPAKGRVPRDIAQDLCMDPDAFSAVAMPWSNVGGKLFWLSNDGDLYSVFYI